MKQYSPVDILQFVLDHKLEFSFLESVTMQKNGFSIAEIPDKHFSLVKETYRLKSVAYHLNIGITDESIITAIRNELYVSAFISRQGESYHIHFLVHRYPISMKGKFEEEITKEVVQYMLMRTIVALRLDTPDKVCDYIGVNKEELID